MKLFEASWRDGYEYFERYYDTNLERSMSNRIDLKCEWYEPYSKGLYTYVLDESIKLDKKQGNAKDGRNHYGFMDPMYRNIRDNYWNKDSYNMSPRVWYLDIETRVGQNSTGFPLPEKALEQISMVQIFDNKLDTVILFALRDWKHQDDYKFEYPVKYVKFNDEIQLLEAFLNLFKKVDPLIIYAWNGSGFDFPYIYNRIKNLGMDTDRLSNYGRVHYSDSWDHAKPSELKKKPTEKSSHKSHNARWSCKFTSDGHFFMDLMDIYKKFTFNPRPSYALDTIAEIEVGERKVQHTEYAGFDDFYTGNYIIPTNPTQEQQNSKIYQRAIKHGVDDEVRELAHSEFCYYGYKDPLLIKKIDDKLNFTTLMCMIAEKMGVQIGDTLGTVKPWSQYIANKSMLDMKVMPKKQEFDSPHVVGGYVRDPEKGKHRWILSADVNSMYPLLGMVGFNMSPETYIPKHKLPPELRDIVLHYFNDQDEGKRLELPEDVWATTTALLKKYNMSLGINGAVFDKSKLGMVPEMVQDIYDSRKKAKKKQFEYERRKILIKEILSKRNG